MSRKNLALAVERQGEKNEAERKSRAALDNDHADFLLDCYNEAFALKFQGQLNEALVLIKQAEKGWKKSSGANHPDTKYAKRARERIEAALKKKQP